LQGAGEHPGAHSDGAFRVAEEIAKAVLFLAADGDYITGQQINVNGGVYM